jgi:photosystem II stability/assembly factor-like uncharacterized protein
MATVYILFLVLIHVIAPGAAAATRSEDSILTSVEPTWMLVSSDWDLDVELRDVKFINATHGWIVGKNGTGIYGGIVLHSSDGGQSWSLQLYNSSQYFRQIDIIDNRIIWITGLGRAFYSLDYGQSWNSSVVVDGESGLSTIAFINSTHGWTATAGTLYHTNNSGQTWEPVPGWTFSNDLPREIQFLSTTEAWAIGYFGIYKTTDGCLTWEKKYGLGGWALSVIDNNEAWAVDDDMLVHMVDGETWIEQPPPRIAPLPLPTLPYFSDILFIDKNNGWIVGSETPVMHTPNAGRDWYEQSTSTEIIGRLKAVDFINETHGWAVGHHGIILRTTHGDGLGTRLWLGLTDPIFLAYVSAIVGVGAALVILVVRHFRRRRLSHSSVLTSNRNELVYR